MKKLILVLSLMLFSTSLFANSEEEVVDNNFLELGMDVMSYDDFSDGQKLPSGVGLNFRWGTFRDTGLYAWASYERPELEMGGEKLADLDTFGLGVGLRVPFENKFYAFAELGAYLPNSTNEAKLPMGGEFTSWSLDYNAGLGGSLGLGYDVTDRFTVNAKYRFLDMTQKVDMVSDEGVSRFKDTVDMSSVSLGLSYRF